MSKRRVIVLSLVAAFFLWCFAWPVLKINLDLRTGKREQESLLLALRERFPHQVFEKGGVGFVGPSVGIRVMDDVDAATKSEIVHFIEKERARRRVSVVIYLQLPDAEDPLKI